MEHVSTTWYHYTGGMNVERVVTNVVGSIEYSAVRLALDTAGERSSVIAAR
jgi:hypothetical protein